MPEPTEQEFNKLLDQSLDLVEMMNHGFVIFQTGPSRWKIKKTTTPMDDREISIETSFDTWEKCSNYVKKLINDRTYQFEVIVRYNRGLGPEHKTLGNVKAKTLPKAQELAKKLAESEIDKEQIIEVRARPLTI